MKTEVTVSSKAEPKVETHGNSCPGAGGPVKTEVGVLFLSKRETAGGEFDAIETTAVAEPSPICHCCCAMM